VVAGVAADATGQTKPFVYDGTMQPDERGWIVGWGFKLGGSSNGEAFRADAEIAGGRYRVR
jgi:hypothetical protein